MPPFVTPDDATTEDPNDGLPVQGREPDDIDPDEIDDEEDDAGDGAKAVEDDPEKPVEEPPEEIVFEGHKVPSIDELRSALEWAFEKEEGMPADFLDRCAEHARLVIEGNTRMNLTKIVEPKELAAKHYLDAWRGMRVVSLLGRSALDIGTGAGFPGIPIALAERDTKVVLLDSIGKKARFVQETIDTMKIPNATALAERAEDHLARNRYEVVFMRAVSSVRENVRTLRKVRHSLVDLVMLKGPSWSREIRGAEREAERLGFRLDTVWEHELPEEMGARAVLVYRAPGGAGL